MMKVRQALIKIRAGWFPSWGLKKTRPYGNRVRKVSLFTLYDPRDHRRPGSSELAQEEEPAKQG